VARTKEETLELVRKLLNMTTDKGCTEAEAAQAAQKVQAILQEHHLSMEQVGVGEEKAEEFTVIRDTLDVSTKGHDGSWSFLLLHHLARYNFCKAVATAGGGPAFLFGDEVDVAVVKELHTWVVEQLERICISMWEEYKGEDRRPTFRRSFFTSAIYTIANRLYESQKEFSAVSEQCTALVVKSREMVDHYVEENLNTRPKRVGGSIGSTAGLTAGIIAGRMVNLDRPLKGVKG
jgi:hypothetical protein